MLEKLTPNSSPEPVYACASSMAVVQFGRLQVMARGKQTPSLGLDVHIDEVLACTHRIDLNAESGCIVDDYAARLIANQVV